MHQDPRQNEQGWIVKSSFKSSQHNRQFSGGSGCTAAGVVAAADEAMLGALRCLCEVVSSGARLGIINGII